MVEFCRPSKSPRSGSQAERSFAMLGFTHYWGRSRKGRWVVKRKTAKDRFSRALRGIGQWCRKHRHRPVREQWAALSRKLRGHYAYYGITGNYQALHRFRWETARRWHTWLNRRHRRRSMTWERFLRLSHTYPLPPRAGRAQCVPLSSDHCLTSRVPGWARPDPWEPRVGNRPRPPGPLIKGMTWQAFPLSPAKAGIHGLFTGRLEPPRFRSNGSVNSAFVIRRRWINDPAIRMRTPWSIQTLKESVFPDGQGIVLSRPLTIRFSGSTNGRPTISHGWTSPFGSLMRRERPGQSPGSSNLA